MTRFVQLQAEWTRPGHHRDCTVRALALTCDLTYEEAHAICKRYGRIHNKGYDLIRAFPIRKVAWGPRGAILKRQKVRGVELVKVTRPRLKLALWLDRHRKGRFIIETSNHAMAVIDGAVHDIWPMKEHRKIVRVLELKVPRRRNRKPPAALDGPGRLAA